MHDCWMVLMGDCWWVVVDDRVWEMDAQQRKMVGKAMQKVMGDKGWIENLKRLAEDG